MARIAGVSEQGADEQVKLTFQRARDGLAHLTGRAPEGAIEPLEVYAHAPGLLAALGAFGAATAAEMNRVDTRYRMLVQLKAATLTHCEYCIDIGSQICRLSGLTDEELLALPNYRTSPLFDEVDKLVLDYAAGMSRTPVDVSDELFARLREHFDDAQIVVLTHLIAGENMQGRFNHALGIGAAGFSEGMVCAVPASN